MPTYSSWCSYYQDSSNAHSQTVVCDVAHCTAPVILHLTSAHIELYAQSIRLNDSWVAWQGQYFVPMERHRSQLSFDIRLLMRQVMCVINVLRLNHMQANYESGLRILHIDRETYELSQVGYFDVYPPGTTAEFNGSWSVYPYFKSGKRSWMSIRFT